MFQHLQTFKPDKNNISWLSNWLVILLSGSKPCNPKPITWKTGSLNFFDSYSGYSICFCLFSARVKD